MRAEINRKYQEISHGYHYNGPEKITKKSFTNAKRDVLYTKIRVIKKYSLNNPTFNLKYLNEK